MSILNLFIAGIFDFGIFILILLEKGQKVSLLKQFFLALIQLALFVLKSLADSLRRGDGTFLFLLLICL